MSYHITKKEARNQDDDQHRRKNKAAVGEPLGREPNIQASPSTTFMQQQRKSISPILWLFGWPLDDFLTPPTTEQVEVPLTMYIPAEIESLDASGVVHVLELGVGLQDVQNSAVSLPQELEPRHHHLTVGPFFLALLSHRGKHDALGGGLGFEVTHLSCLDQ